MQSVDISVLFENKKPSPAVDRQIAEGACDLGFLLLSGLPDWALMTAERRRRLTAVFALPDEEKRRLTRRRHVAANPNIYRGFEMLGRSYRPDSERMDVGPDAVDPQRVQADGHPLREATPWPQERLLPDWKKEVSAYYAAMERLGEVILRALARALGLLEDELAGRFRHGISTLRFIHFLPTRDSGPLLAGAHEDTGFTTLLHQDEAGGLELQTRDGAWQQVPPGEGRVAVNFGLLFERWTQGRVRATPHRVTNRGRERHSIVFFHEPAFDAEFAPLPGAESHFKPFTYGPFLWHEMQRYSDFEGIEQELATRGALGAA